MFNRLPNQNIPKGRLALLLAQVVAALSKHLDTLNERVAELESAAAQHAAKNTAHPVRRRKTIRPMPGYSVEAGLPTAAVLGNRLKVDGRHCQELIGRTKAVLRFCLTAL